MKITLIVKINSWDPDAVSHLGLHCFHFRNSRHRWFIAWSRQQILRYIPSFLGKIGFAFHKMKARLSCYILFGVFVFELNISPTAMVIWRRGNGLKSHPTDWRSWILNMWSFTTAAPWFGLENLICSKLLVALKDLTLKAPIATKVVCFSRLLICLRSLYDKQFGPRSDCSYRSSLRAVCFGSTLVASMLVFFSNNRQLFAADDFSRRHFQMHFFLGTLRVNTMVLCFFTEMQHKWFWIGQSVIID